MVKTKLITITVWDCGVESHQHKTKLAAETCQKKQPARLLKDIQAGNESKAVEALHLLHRGGSLKDACAALGVNYQKLRSLLRLAWRIASHIDPSSFPDTDAGIATFKAPYKNNDSLLLAAQIIKRRREVLGAIEAGQA